MIRTSPRATLSRRIAEIFDGITEVIDRHAPEAIAVESVFFAKNARTTLVLGHARGVVLLAGERAGLSIHEYAPKLVKKTVVGVGTATKQQVQAMVARLLHLKRAPEPADAADGVACALTCVLAAGFQARVAALATTNQRQGTRSFPAILRPDLSKLRVAR